ncbi:MAG: L,D-transpeptidase [Anaerolineae bacterium]|nr:L,D-transpeptidase [Anaerolineae bacterium]MCI0609505.1 L,D-transpeptidase [Anaerolineae bacterium]
MSPNRHNRFPLLLILCLLFCGGIVPFAITASPVSASIFGTMTPTATQENLWAYADVPKPTYTPANIADSVPTVAAAPTETTGSMVMEIVTDTQFSAVSQGSVPVTSYGGSKYILVDISEQHMYVFESDALTYSFVASTGIKNSTRVGTFQVQTKLPNAYASTWSLWMPNWLGIYYSSGLENGIHALPILSNGATLWAGFLGSPVSYGCVVLGTYESQLLYDWAELGTPVEIRW